MLPLLLLVHLGPLFEFFHQAGYPPRFVVFLSGTTGSMKTSLALCLFHLFDGDGEKPEANFQDTEAALEMKLGGAHSRVLLVDDFCPAVTTASGKLKLARLELIIRFIGDQISKSRSTPTLKRAKEFAPAGCCIVTGESTGGTRSTLLRCLLLAIDRKDIDGNKLRIYQENPLLLQTHMVHFLHWCGYNGDSIIDFLKKEFLNERQSFMTVVAERRVVDCGATLMLVARLFLEYALSIGALESNDVEILAPLWRQVIEAALRSSEAATKELNPLSMYLSAVFNLRRSGRLPLASSSDAYSPEKHLGFLDGDLWWVRSDDLFKCVLQYWRGSGQIFPLRDGDIKKLLAANELIEVDHEVCNGRSKTLYMRKTSLDGRPRMLVLRSDSAQEYLERELKNFEL